MKKIYLDYAATTPVDKAVAKAMAPFLSEKFGNASSLHSFGREAKVAIETSRATLAKFINAKPNEIIFTSSDTESNNFALKGIVVRKAEGPQAGGPEDRSDERTTEVKKHGHVILSAIEHDSTMEIADSLKQWATQFSYIPVNNNGVVNPADIKNAIRENTILVSVIFASNELGTLQPIEEISKICRDKGILFHTDASQAFGKVAIDVQKMNIDLLSASAHKMYGPKGAAFLYVRTGVSIEPLLHGGGQEFGQRGSTVNVPAIVGFAKAAEVSYKIMERENKRLEKLRKKLISEVLKIEGAHLSADPEKRVPHIINLWFSDVDGEMLVTHLDLKGIACSTGSACSSLDLEASHILQAIGLTKEQAQGSLRISLGRKTTEEEIRYFVKVLRDIVGKLKKNL